MPFPITATFGEFASRQRFEQIPPEALVAVRMGICDFVACMFAGKDRPPPRIIRENLDTLGIRDDARIQLGNERASAADAARANAAAGAFLDFDDVALKGSHPSSILAAVLLAEGDALGSSGKDLLAAYAVGFEVWARLIEREPDAYLERGWHTTAVIGPVAAAAALANLHRLTSAGAANAIALGASAAGGLTGNFRTGGRVFHVALAAGSAVSAARLAKAGLDGGKTVIEQKAGYLTALSPKGNVDTETPIDDLGTAWRLASGGLNLKKYPMALATHRAIDGISELVAAGLRPADVASVTLCMGPSQVEYRARLTGGAPLAPLSRAEIGLAAILFDGKVTLGHLDKAFYERADIAAFTARVREETDPMIRPDKEPNLGFATRLRVTTTDGRTLESRDAEVPRGNWRLKLTVEDQWDKFSACTEGMMPGDRARGLFDDLQALEKVPSIKALNAG